jgi:hypothetical protein
MRKYFTLCGLTYMRYFLGHRGAMRVVRCDARGAVTWRGAMRVVRCGAHRLGLVRWKE